MTTRNRGRRSSRGGRGPKPKTFWEQYRLGSNLAASAQSVGRLTPDFVSGAARVKIIRLIGSVDLRSAAGSGSAQWGFGISVVTEDAALALVTPDPLSDDNQSWYLWDAGHVVSAFDNSAVERHSFDIRSQRVLRAGFDLQLVFETGLFSGITSLALDFQARALWTMG